MSSPNSPSLSASDANPAEETKDSLFSHLVKTLDEKDKVEEETLLPFTFEATKCHYVEPNPSLKTPADTASHLYMRKLYPFAYNNRERLEGTPAGFLVSQLDNFMVENPHLKAKSSSTHFDRDEGNLSKANNLLNQYLPVSNTS